MQRPLWKQGPLHFSYTKNEISYVNGLLCDLDSTFTLNRAGFVRNFLFFLLLKKIRWQKLQLLPFTKTTMDITMVRLVVLVILLYKKSCCTTQFSSSWTLDSPHPGFFRAKIHPISADKSGTVFNHLCTHLLTSIPVLCCYSEYLKIHMIDSSGTGSSTQ